jgi:hypothetical protein
LVFALAHAPQHVGTCLDCCCCFFLQHKRKERIMLLNRKGFVRIAVEQGLDGGIIPVYHYGNTQVRAKQMRRCACTTTEVAGVVQGSSQALEGLGALA